MEGHVKILKRKVGAALGFSERTGYNRINDLNWACEEDPITREVFCWVPRTAIANKEFLPDVTPAQPVAKLPESTNPFLQHYEAQAQTNAELLKTKDELLQAKEQMIATLQEENSRLNREIENRNTQIQRYKSQEDALNEIKDLLGQKEKSGGFRWPWQKP